MEGKCSIDGCDNKQNFDAVPLCSTHWRLVPKSLQVNIQAAAGWVEQDPERMTKAIEEAVIAAKANAAKN